MNILEFLDYTKTAKETHCVLREKFHNLYAKGAIFSIRFGVGFFEEVKERLITGKEIDNADEYDYVFNRWLRKTRKELIKQ